LNSNIPFFNEPSPDCRGAWDCLQDHALQGNEGGSRNPGKPVKRPILAIFITVKKNTPPLPRLSARQVKMARREQKAIQLQKKHVGA